MKRTATIAASVWTWIDSDLDNARPSSAFLFIVPFIPFALALELAGAEGFARAWAVAASGGLLDGPTRKLTRGEVAQAASEGMVRVLMRRGRYVRTRLVPQVSALLRLLAQFDRACGPADVEVLWEEADADTFRAGSVNRTALWGAAARGD